MSCVTCEITPPPGHSTHTPGSRPPGMVSARWLDAITFGLHVIWRGRNVTHMIIEALPGDADTGWVETYLLDDQGAPKIHPARYVCANPECEHDTGGWDQWPEADSIDTEAYDPPAEPVRSCPECGSVDAPRKLWDDHPHTVIRTGPVTVITGTTIHTG